jgi:hypothetical protein
VSSSLRLRVECEIDLVPFLTEYSCSDLGNGVVRVSSRRQEECVDSLPSLVPSTNQYIRWIQDWIHVVRVKGTNDSGSYALLGAMDDVANKPWLNIDALPRILKSVPRTASSTGCTAHFALYVYTIYDVVARFSNDKDSP